MKHLTMMEIRRLTHKKFLDTRNLDYYIGSLKFETAYNMADDRDKTDITERVKAGNLLQIRRYVKKILQKDLGNKGVMELRRIASRLGVTGASSIDKAGLLFLIKKETENEKE